jgi:cell division protein ZapE
MARITRRKPEPARGVYLWGGVGRGKSMLMDLFFDCTDIANKRRVHFHEFMQEVHDRLRSARAIGTGDPVLEVADAIAAETRLIAFDEMVVTNSADAMIVSRLFTRIIAHGVTVVATSNRPPRDLYKNGLNREHFLPFVALLKQRLDVLALDGPTDYRLARMAGMRTWHVPNGEAATQALSGAFFRLTDFAVEDREHVPSETIAIKGGRELFVPKALKGVAVFSFKRLCGEPRGIPTTWPWPAGIIPSSWPASRRWTRTTSPKRRGSNSWSTRCMSTASSCLPRPIATRTSSTVLRTTHSSSSGRSRV